MGSNSRKFGSPSLEYRGPYRFNAVMPFSTTRDRRGRHVTGASVDEKAAAVAVGASIRRVRLIARLGEPGDNRGRNGGDCLRIFGNRYGDSNPGPVAENHVS